MGQPAIAPLGMSDKWACRKVTFRQAHLVY